MRRLEEQATREADEELQRRAEAEAERQRKGEKRRGREPRPVDDTPSDKAPMRFTDAELHIMRTHNKGGMTVVMRKPVWMQRIRSSWPVT